MAPLALLALLTSAADVEPRLQEADARLAAANVDGARAILGPLADDPTVSPATRAQAAMRLGLVETGRGRPDRALAAFKAAVAQDATVQLPAAAPPEAGTLFQQARSELAATPPPPAPLPEKPPVKTEPALGWARPTSYVVVVAGALMLVAGAAVAVGAFAFREYVARFAPADQASQLARGFLPIAGLAAALLLLGIPVAGTGLALFFLSGEDGPLRYRRPDNE